MQIRTGEEIWHEISSFFCYGQDALSVKIINLLICFRIVLLYRIVLSY